MVFSSLDLGKVKTVSLKRRKSKVKAGDFGQAFAPGGSFRQYLATLPNILAAGEFKEVVARTATAVRQGRPIIFAMGAHVIKVGLSPIIVDLIRRQLISLVAVNGAGLIHDLEIALVGQTSEEVEEELKKGKFGMAQETAQFLNNAINHGVSKGLGLGQAVAEALARARLPHAGLSIALACAQTATPITCHVALGTDIIHLHPSMDGAATGLGSFRDFKTFASAISQLNGGVFFNIGSAVILPEVFLKALTLVRNLGFKVTRFTTVNMDFIKHYRPLTNVVKRPTDQGGKGFNLVGHHELMVPLLAAALLEELVE